MELRIDRGVYNVASTLRQLQESTDTVTVPATDTAPTPASGVFFTFDGAIVASEVRIVGANGVEILGTSGTVFAIRPSAPVVSFSGLTFRGGDSAIRMHGGSAVVNDCHFTEHDSTALVMSDGEIVVRSSNFTYCGRRATPQGGAIKATGSSHVLIEASTFLNNKAVDGAAIFAGESAVVRTSLSVFELNNATARGGALFVTNDARVRLSNQTRLMRNRAQIEGESMFLNGDRASAMYILPAPLGHWVSSTLLCDEAEASLSTASADACPLNSTFTRLVRGAHDDDFPFGCAVRHYSSSA
jgi:hypothetical protein